MKVVASGRVRKPAGVPGEHKAKGGLEFLEAALVSIAIIFQSDAQPDSFGVESKEQMLTDG